MFPKHFLVSTSFLFLTACSVGPDYITPELSLPEAFSNQTRYLQTQTTELSDSTQYKELWWENFSDPRLEELMKEVVSSNLELKSRLAQIATYYARLGVSRSDFLPRFKLEGNSRREQLSERTVPEFKTDIFNLYSIGLTTTWEIDLWGKLRRSNEAAAANLLEAEGNHGATLLSITTAAAEQYFKILETDEIKKITESTIKSRREYMRLIENKYKAGAVPELDLRQAESEVLNGETDLPALRSTLDSLEQGLLTLCGKYAGNISRGKSLEELAQNIQIPSALPSSLLTQRPDIQAAEARYRSALATVGVQYAEYFPDVSLTGAYGYSSSAFNKLVHEPAERWNFGPQVSLPIFTANAVSNRVEAARSEALAAEAQYRQTVLQAFAEVNNALSTYANTKQSLSIFKAQVVVLKRYFDLSQARYNEGQTSYLEVLDAERRYFAAQIEYAKSLGEFLRSVVTVYKTIGGDWIKSLDESAQKLTKS